uniref:NB-ARC domain-containing protein n=1 Tax=Solanum lycopersicum TaxID=4081 RepID=K4D412_SOLLC
MSTTHLNYCVSLVKCRGTIFSEGANATMSDPLVGTDVQVLLERDNDIAEIKEKILNLKDDVVLLTISIVGMGGLGGKTLAKKIFNDKQFEKHFGKRVWLCLPEMSETKSLLELILESLTKRKVETLSGDIIVKMLQDELAGRRYLLVLDDLWRVDSTL